jgi:hypothetical protein
MVVGSKTEYLKRLTSQFRMKSVDVGKELAGSTPPSVFIGSWNYPKVFAGPMMVPEHGDTSVVDTPEQWIPGGVSTQDIVGFRMNLVRGKQQVGVTDLDNKLIGKLREISLSSKSVESEAVFVNKPIGHSFTDEHTPHGPSAMLRDFDVEIARWDKSLEKVYYDGDLLAKDAVIDLYNKGLPFSRIQKAFSIGSMGIDKNRKLVPTRWSITACDTALGDIMLDDVRHNPVIDTYRVYEFDSLHNYYAVILTPTPWQYEWIEAFLHVMGNEEAIFADHEYNTGKKGYSCVGGCYYSCKFGVLEALARAGEQAGALVLREAYKGYVPLGVFNVRENVRTAMKQQYREFPSLKDTLAYLSPKFRLPISTYVKTSTLLKEMLVYKQVSLSEFVK